MLAKDEAVNVIVLMEIKYSDSRDAMAQWHGTMAVAYWTLDLDYIYFMIAQVQLQY